MGVRGIEADGEIYGLFHGLQGVKRMADHEKTYRVQADALCRPERLPHLPGGNFLADLPQHLVVSRFHSEGYLVAAGVFHHPEQLPVDFIHPRSVAEAPREAHSPVLDLLA